MVMIFRLILRSLLTWKNSWWKKYSQNMQHGDKMKFHTIISSFYIHDPFCYLEESRKSCYCTSSRTARISAAALRSGTKSASFPLRPLPAPAPAAASDCSYLVFRWWKIGTLCWMCEVLTDTAGKGREVQVTSGLLRISTLPPPSNAPRTQAWDSRPSALPLSCRWSSSAAFTGGEGDMKQSEGES